MKEVFTHMLIPKKSAGFPPWLGGMRLSLFSSFPIQTVSGAVEGKRGQPLAEATVLKLTNGITTASDGRHLTCL